MCFDIQNDSLVELLFLYPQHMFMIRTQKMYVLLSPYLYLTSFLFIICLCLFVLGDDTLISKVFYMQTKLLCILIHSRNKGEVDTYRQTCLNPLVNFLLTVPRQCFFCGSFLLFVFRDCLCHTVFLSVPYSLLVACWKRAGLLALLYMMLSCVSVTFPYGFLCQVWYLNVSIPDLCLLPYFG